MMTLELLHAKCSEDTVFLKEFFEKKNWNKRAMMPLDRSPEFLALEAPLLKLHTL